jgi:phenylpyruvate tautomerase PptA (4-oxalocrotonate tautomerase family)
MPILDVEVVLRPGETLDPQLAGQIADRAASIFDAAPGGTWVKLRGLPSQQYAEDSGGPPSGVYPVFVSVLKARQPSPAAMAAEAARLAAAVARVCGRPQENVHVLYLPDAAGRIAFGGKLLAKD